ncbi:sensor domain-containing protein [Pseudomonas sp. TE3610]
MMPNAQSVTDTAAQLAALDRVMAIARFSPQGMLLDANTNYQALLGYEGVDLRGRHHSTFCPPALVQSAEYAAFWHRLGEGGTRSGIAERRRRDGSSCWLEATYLPVLDETGQVAQVLKIATDITARLEQERAQQERLKLLSIAAEVSDTAAVITDRQGLITYTNIGFRQMFGWADHELWGCDPVQLLAPRNESTAEDGGHREAIVTGKQGQRYWARMTSNPIVDDAGRLLHTVTLFTDITESKIHRALQHQVLEAVAREQPLNQILELICLEVERIAPEVTASILAVDDQGQLHSLAAPSLDPEYCRQLNGLNIGPKVGSCGTAAWRNEAVRVDNIAEDPLWADFLYLALPLGIIGSWSTPIRNSQGVPIGTFAFYFHAPRNAFAEAFHQRLVDACANLCALALERDASRHRIRQLAFYDGLTGLPNRSFLQTRADQIIAGLASREEPVAVLFINLDRFTQVNDSLGHPAGDELLRRVATRLQQEVSEDDIAARLSADEFVIVLCHCDAERAALTVERIQTQLSQPTSIAQTPLTITASVGIAVYPLDGTHMETLLHRADIAMHQAKSSGRGTFRFFSQEMNSVAREHLALESALSQALANQQLHLHYQPQVELASGRLYGVEALARWSHPHLGDISPGRFIPLAEESGMIDELGRWALDEACRQLAAWRARGLDIPSVAVNLSSVSFHRLDLVHLVDSLLHRYHLTPQDLILELTESILLDSNPSTLETIQRIQARGIRLSMDDFGTGYSSLSYLRRLPFHELKLDRSFVADLDHSEAARALSQAILGVGQSLHLTLVAEGIETHSQRARLQEQGYPVGQGYLFSPPLAPQALEHWLAQSAASRALSLG